MKKRILIFPLFFAINSPVIAEITLLNNEETLGVKSWDVTFGSCHIKLTDPFNGDIDQTFPKTAKGFSYNGPLMQGSKKNNYVAIQMWCEKISDELLRDCGITLKDGKLNTTNTDGESEDVIHQINQQRIVLNGKNWSGAGYTEDQINGEEDLRVRSFHFCAVKEEKTVYGRIESAAKLRNLKESAMPNIIRLLEGIEFIDD